MNTLGSGYRLFCGPWWKHWFDPSTYYYWLKWKIQRAQRGWADCDTWSLDNYLSQWLPGALQHLKKTTHGIPGSMFEGLPHDDYYNYGEEGSKTAEKRWDDILDKMTEGFRAKNRMDNLLYDEELGPYPYGATREIKNERYQKSVPLRERDEKLFEEGIRIFAEHFESLWD